MSGPAAGLDLAEDDVLENEKSLSFQVGCMVADAVMSAYQEIGALLVVRPLVPDSRSVASLIREPLKIMRAIIRFAPYS